MSTHQTTLIIGNYTAQALTFGGATASFSDDKPTASSSSVSNGSTLSVTLYLETTAQAVQSSSFRLTLGSGYFFTVTCIAQAGEGSIYVTGAGLPSSYVYGGNNLTFSFPDQIPAAAALNLYLGVAVSATGAPTAYAVPLASNPYAQSGNCQDFANSMFGPNMRSSALVSQMYNQSTSPMAPADFTGGQLNTVVQSLVGYWMSTSTTATAATDKPIIDFLKSFFSGPNTAGPGFYLWYPVLSYVAGSDPAVYTLQEYTDTSFRTLQNNNTTWGWDQQCVSTFLTLLLSGAHFVCVSADLDFSNQNVTAPNPRRDLYQAFRNSDLTQRGDTANSHYCGTSWYNFNTTGEYYLDITDEFAPANCGFLLALLFGRTVNSLSADSGTYNTFMQLEGWPAHGTGGDRHMADYDAYQQSLWNISTYGASVYSEKRATTVFLAPGGWMPHMYTVTGMMPYVGAYATGTYPNGSPQGWVNTSVFKTRQGVPTLPSKYYE
jgi:hypothetical protein